MSDKQDPDLEGNEGTVSKGDSFNDFDQIVSAFYDAVGPLVLHRVADVGFILQKSFDGFLHRSGDTVGFRSTEFEETVGVPVFERVKKGLIQFVSGLELWIKINQIMDDITFTHQLIETYERLEFRIIEVILIFQDKLLIALEFAVVFFITIHY